MVATPFLTAGKVDKSLSFEIGGSPLISSRVLYAVLHLTPVATIPKNSYLCRKISDYESRSKYPAEPVA